MGRPRKNKEAELEPGARTPDNRPDVVLSNASIPVVKVIEPESGTSGLVLIAGHDTTIYHNEHTPRNVKTGEEIPDGWTEEPRELSVKWQNKLDGSWFKVPA